MPDTMARNEGIRKTSIFWRCDNGKTERMFLYSARGVSLYLRNHHLSTRWVGCLRSSMTSGVVPAGRRATQRRQPSTAGSQTQFLIRGECSP